ncbi:hypothetical protein LTR97_012138 [Elasticomyces elasticus]|uniref:Uncharacterized protein n=1 Tax=Elasticomyces elasticus TaxID=574655 RepID=A0AAN7VY00_9PEZI|nr:hypothetical protein LTR97_012138 [Elasticomyces elasticus]
MDYNSSTSNSNSSPSGSGSRTTPPPNYSSPPTSQSTSSAPSADLPLTAYTGPNIAAGLATFRGMTAEQQVDHVRGMRSRVDVIADLVRAAANPRPETENVPDINPAETTNEPLAETTNEQLAETANEPPTTSNAENQVTTVPRLRGMTFDQLRSHIVGILPIMVQEDFPRLPGLSDFHLAIAIAVAQMLTEDSRDVETDDAYLNHTVGSVMDHYAAHSQDPAYLASRNHTIRLIRLAAAACGRRIAAHINGLVFAETTDDLGYNYDDWMTDEDYNHEIAEMRIVLATEEAEEAAMAATMRAENEALRAELEALHQARREYVAENITVSVQHRPTNQHDWTAADVATLARDREEAENVRDAYHTINGVIMNGFESEVPAPHELEPANESMARQATEYHDTKERLTAGQEYQMIAEISGDTLANYSAANDVSDTMSVTSDDYLPADPLDAYHDNLEATHNAIGAAMAYDILLTRVAGPNHYRAVGDLAEMMHQLTWTRFSTVINNTAQNLIGRERETRAQADMIYTGWCLAAARMPYRNACAFTRAAYLDLHHGYTGIQSHAALVNALLDRFHAAHADIRAPSGRLPAYNNWAIGHPGRTGR